MHTLKVHINKHTYHIRESFDSLKYLVMYKNAKKLIGCKKIRINITSNALYLKH